MAAAHESRRRLPKTQKVRLEERTAGTGYSVISSPVQAWKAAPLPGLHGFRRRREQPPKTIKSVIWKYGKVKHRRVNCGTITTYLLRLIFISYPLSGQPQTPESHHFMGFVRFITLLYNPPLLTGMQKCRKMNIRGR